MGTGNKIIFEHLPHARRCDQHSTEVASVQELNANKTLRQPPGAHHHSRVPAGAISCPCHNHTRGGQSCISTQKLKLRGALACCHIGLKPGALRGWMSRCDSRLPDLAGTCPARALSCQSDRCYSGLSEGTQKRGQRMGERGRLFQAESSLRSTSLPHHPWDVCFLWTLARRLQFGGLCTCSVSG